jgi:hypothetical protein
MGLFRFHSGFLSRLAKLGTFSVASSAVLAFGQAATTLVVPQGPLLPQKFSSWIASSTQAIPSPLAGGNTAQVLREDGLTRSSSATYEQPGHPGTIKLDALQFDDATGAVAAFTLLRSPDMRVVTGDARIGKDEATAGNRYLFREGASVVSVETSLPSSGIVADLRQLAIALPKIGGPKGASPLLPTLLPAEGLIPSSIHYSVGASGYAAQGGTLPPSILGFDKSAEAVTAEYAVHGGKGILTLLLFPTPEIAGNRGRAVESALNASGERAGTAKLRRIGPLVALARGGFTPEEAQTLIEDVHLRQEVTWNKAIPPEFHAEVRKTASLLVSIAVFSGVLGLAAVLLGLFLGLGRAWIRVLLGKPAATEPEFLRLDLSARANGERAGRI